MISSQSADEPRLVVRPSIPLVVWWAAAIWVGVTIAEIIAWESALVGESAQRAWALVVVTLLLTVVGAARRFGVAVLLGAGLATGLIAGTLCFSAWRAEVYRIEQMKPGPYDVICIADAKSDRFGTRFRALAMLPGGDQRIEVTVPKGASAPEIGQRVRTFGALVPSKYDERGRFSHRNGVVARLSARTLSEPDWAPGFRGWVGRLRLSAVERVELIAGDGGALVAGVGLGDRRRLAGTELEADFRTTGLSHLIAVSGTHLVVVAALLSRLLIAIRTPRLFAMLATVAITGCYVLVTGAQASATRAWLMCVVVALAGLSRRRSDAAAGLALAVAYSLVQWPYVAFDIGFQLSVSAVAGLVLFARFAEAWLASALPAQVARLIGPVALTLVAQTATLPVAVPVFGVLSLVAPVANVACAPLVSVVLTLTVVGLASGAVIPAAGTLLLSVAGAVGAGVADLARTLASVNGAAIPVNARSDVTAALCLLGAAAVWATWPRPERSRARVGLGAAGLLFAVMLFGAPASQGVRVVVLDVGQGDAILIRDGPHAALVDTGPSPGVLREALSRFGIRDVGAVVLTHAHDDHTAGTPALTGVHRVGTLFVPAEIERSAFARQQAQVRTAAVPVTSGHTITVGEVVVTVLWPMAPVDDAAENDSSVVALVEYGASKVLLTGDAEAEVLDELARRGMLTDIDVLKVGHHGSDGAVSEASMRILRPEIAVISVGKGNRFGHPRAETLDMLTAFGSTILRTDRDGDVEFALDEHGVSVSHGFSQGRYATLGGDQRACEEYFDGWQDRRPQARLPHTQRPDDASRPSAHQAARTRGRSRGPGLQLRDPRWRDGQPRFDRCGSQYAAVRERAPPRGGSKHRQDGQRRA